MHCHVQIVNCYFAAPVDFCGSIDRYGLIFGCVEVHFFKRLNKFAFLSNFILKTEFFVLLIFRLFFEKGEEKQRVSFCPEVIGEDLIEVEG